MTLQEVVLRGQKVYSWAPDSLLSHRLQGTPTDSPRGSSCWDEPPGRSRWEQHPTAALHLPAEGSAERISTSTEAILDNKGCIWKLETWCLWLVICPKEERIKQWRSFDILKYPLATVKSVFPPSRCPTSKSPTTLSISKPSLFYTPPSCILLSRCLAIQHHFLQQIPLKWVLCSRAAAQWRYNPSPDLLI